MKINNRITKHWITTLMGVLTFLFSLVMMWFEKGNIWVNLSMIPLAFMLIRSKDDIIERITFGLLKVKRDE